MQNQDELTPQERELEHALKTLRPAPARIDPVTAVLAGERRVNRRRVQFWQAAAAAAIVVAGGVWIVLGPRDADQDRITQPVGAAATQTVAANRVAHVPPTLLSYQRALADSPAALDALLDAQVMAPSARDAEITQASVLTFWNSNLPGSLGEM